MAKVTIIPSKINPITHQHLDVKVKRRVAAYARVSTDDEMQLTSYEAQVDYYTKLIKANDELEFVKFFDSSKETKWDFFQNDSTQNTQHL